MPYVTPLDCAVATRLSMLGMLPDGDGTEHAPIYMHWSGDFGIRWDRSDRQAVLVDYSMDRIGGTHSLPLGLAMNLCARACEPGRNDASAYIIEIWQAAMKRHT